MHLEAKDGWMKASSLPSVCLLYDPYAIEPITLLLSDDERMGVEACWMEGRTKDVEAREFQFIYTCAYIENLKVWASADKNSIPTTRFEPFVPNAVPGT